MALWRLVGGQHAMPASGQKLEIAPDGVDGLSWTDLQPPFGRERE
jgi:hypothetical protein